MRKFEVPKKTESNGEEKETHPAYGTCLISRSTGGVKLHGSALAQHNSFITLTIRHAERIHHLHQDWHHQKDMVTEIWMSHAQFAEMITTPNIGVGIPCTIRFITKTGNGYVPEIAFETEVEAKKVVDGFNKDQEGFVELLKVKTKEVEEILNKKSINKSDRGKIHDTLSFILREVISNRPFVVEQFQHAAEKVVTQGKAELDAMISGIVNRLGMKSLKQLAEVACGRDVKMIESIHEDEK